MADAKIKPVLVQYIGLVLFEIKIIVFTARKATSHKITDALFEDLYGFQRPISSETLKIFVEAEIF